MHRNIFRDEIVDDPLVHGGENLILPGSKVFSSRTSRNKAGTIQPIAASSDAVYTDSVVKTLFDENGIAQFDEVQKREIASKCAKDLWDSQWTASGNIDEDSFLRQSDQRARDLNLDIDQYFNYIMLNTDCADEIYKFLLRVHVGTETDEKFIWMRMMTNGYTAVEKYIPLPASIGGRDLDHIMIIAAANGFKAVVDRMWQLGANDIVKALTSAAVAGYLDIVKKLQYLGAYDVRVVGYAAGMGHVDVVKFLLYGHSTSNHPNRHAPNDIDQALAMAALYGKIAVINMLIDMYPNYNAKLGFMMAARGGHTAIMKIMKKRMTKDRDDYRKTLLFHSDKEYMKIMNKYNQVEKKNYGEALILASRGGHVDTVEWLLFKIACRYVERQSIINAAMAEAGANRYVLNFLIAAGGSNYAGALISAAKYKDTDMIEQLLERDDMPTYAINEAAEVAARHGNIAFESIIGSATTNLAAAIIAAAEGPSVEEYESIRGPLYQNAYWNIVDYSMYYRRNIIYNLLEKYYHMDNKASNSFFIITKRNVEDAFVVAARSGALEIVELLMEQLFPQLVEDAKVGLYGRTTSPIVGKALSAAALGDHSQVVEYLLHYYHARYVVEDFIMGIISKNNTHYEILPINKYGYYGNVDDIPDRVSNRYQIVKRLLPALHSVFMINKVMAWAAQYGYDDIITQALQLQANDIVHALNRAMESGYLAIVQYLLQLQPEVIQPSNQVHARHLSIAVKNGHERIINLFMQDNTYSNADLNMFMSNAALGGHIETMELLRTYGAIYTEETLSSAIFGHRANVVQMLLQQGITTNKEVNSHNIDLLHMFDKNALIKGGRYSYQNRDRYLLVFVR